MLSRRFVVGCAICAVSGFVAAEVNGQTAPPAPTGLRRKILKEIDGPTPGYVTILAEAEIDANFAVARHTHPGVESTYLVEGGGELSIDGQAPRLLSPGEAFQVAAGTPHSLKNGGKMSKLASTYILEKGKPLASPA